MSIHDFVTYDMWNLADCYITYIVIKETPLLLTPLCTGVNVISSSNFQNPNPPQILWSITGVFRDS